MRTDDGWTVEVINLNGAKWFKVKRKGILEGGTTRRPGLVKTIAEVEKILGPSFAQLH